MRKGASTHFKSNTVNGNNLHSDPLESVKELNLYFQNERTHQRAIILNYVYPKQTMQMQMCCFSTCGTYEPGNVCKQELDAYKLRLVTLLLLIELEI